MIAESANRAAIARRLVRLLPLAVALSIPAIFVPGIGGSISDSAVAIRNFAADVGPVIGGAAGIALTAAAVALGAPRLALAFAAGLVFGGPTGLAVNIAGSLLGALLTFLISRRAAGPCGPAVAGCAAFSARRAAAIAAARIAPLPGAATTVAMAAAPCSVAEFLAGSAAGFLPAAAVAAWAGAAA